MRKMNKIINIILIFMLIGVLLEQDCAYSQLEYALRVPLIGAKKPVSIKVEFESILKEIPKDISIKDGVEIIQRYSRLKEIEKYLEKFENLRQLFSHEFVIRDSSEQIFMAKNMYPLFVETRRSPEDLDKLAGEILADKELMFVFNAMDKRTRYLLPLAVLASENTRRTIKAFVKKTGSEEIFKRVWGEFVVAYLASRKTREAVMALLNTVSPSDFRLSGRMKHLAPDFKQYYADRSDIYYEVFTAIWFYLTPVYEKLKARGYSFEEAGQALAYFCEHFLDRGPRVFLYNYDYKLWLKEDWEFIKEYTSEEELKIMMDIIKTSPKGVFVDKANKASFGMIDICRSMRDEIESLGRKFMGTGQSSISNDPYLAEFPLYQFYELLLRYSWFSHPRECETQEDAGIFSFKLHYYVPLLSAWVNSNDENSLINALAKSGITVEEAEKIQLRKVLEDVRKGVEELKKMTDEIPLPAYDEAVDVNRIIREILEEGSYKEIHLNILDSLPVTKGGNRVLLKKALTGLLRSIDPFKYLWDGITIKTFMSSGNVHIIISDVPIERDLEVIKIMLDPARLYLLEDRLDILSQGQYFSESAAIIRAHGGGINVEAGAGKSVTFTITLPIAIGQKAEIFKPLSNPENPSRENL
jgi:alkylhydroperoxidase/carboxymuconolactone decarboxylase family protein YurZ